MNQDDCIFCKIATKKIPTIITENAGAMMFMDANPLAPVHYIIIPKDHYQDLLDLQAHGDAVETLGDMYALIDEFIWENKVSFDFDLAETGFRTIINTGINAGQTVKHLHIHLLGGAQLKNDFGAV
jgi:histidine triad (HIT) family protein